MEHEKGGIFHPRRFLMGAAGPLRFYDGEASPAWWRQGGFLGHEMMFWSFGLAAYKKDEAVPPKSDSS